MAEAIFMQATEKCDSGAWSGFCVLMWDQFGIRLPGGELMTLEHIEKFREVARQLLEEEVSTVRDEGLRVRAAREAMESRAAEIKTLSRRTGRPVPGVVTLEMKQSVEDECAKIVEDCACITEACDVIASNVGSYVQTLARRKGE